METSTARAEAGYEKENEAEEEEELKHSEVKTGKDGKADCFFVFFSFTVHLPLRMTKTKGSKVNYGRI